MGAVEGGNGPVPFSLEVGRGGRAGKAGVGEVKPVRVFEGGSVEGIEIWLKKTDRPK